MSNTSKLKLIFCLALISLCLGARPAWAQSLLEFSSSSQIAEAFGKDVIKRFENRYDIDVNLHVGSSETALLRLKNNFSDLACIASRLPKDYTEKGYVEIPFAKDPLVIITHKQNPIESLSPAQVRKIFMQHTTNWKKVSGPDQEIVTIIPSQDTALYKSFERQIMQGFNMSFDFSSYISTNNFIAVEHIPGAISFASRGAAKNYKNIKCLKINESKPEDEAYPFFQTFSFISKGRPKENAQEFINAALSSRGREIIKEKGMYPIFEDRSTKE
ncbi:MAG: substrate-binding domain-containing protein [Desulfohalobiaceae bacterium]